jgi:hypothetical protein
MMSVNQISVYHTLLEAYNIMRYWSSEQIHTKRTEISAKKYSLKSITNNDLKDPEKPKGPSIIYVSMFLPIFDQLSTLVSMFSK